MRAIRFALPLLVICAVVLCTACSGSTTMPSSNVAKLSISGAAPALNSTSQYSATATLMDGTVVDVTSQVSWQTSNAGILTVSANGVVKGVSVGTATLTATYQGVSVSQTVTI